MTDDPNLSELLDDDKLPAEYPPERPLGVDDAGVTADHGAVGDTLAQRVAREEPETVVQPSSDDGAVAHLVAPEEGSAPDTTKEAVATAVGDEDPGSLDTADLVAGSDTTRDVATERVDDRSAEELAVHLTDAPPVEEPEPYVDEDGGPA